jgi:hypothetical protein
MKGRPLRGGDEVGNSGRGHVYEASMKGRPLRGGDWVSFAILAATSLGVPR